MNISGKYAVSQGVVSTEMEGESVLMHVAKGQYYSLNEVGSVIWAFLRDQSATLEDICHRVITEFEVDEEVCRRDVSHLLKHMESAGVVEKLS